MFPWTDASFGFWTEADVPTQKNPQIRWRDTNTDVFSLTSLWCFFFCYLCLLWWSYDFVPTFVPSRSSFVFSIILFKTFSFTNAQWVAQGKILHWNWTFYIKSLSCWRRISDAISSALQIKCDSNIESREQRRKSLIRNKLRIKLNFEVYVWTEMVSTTRSLSFTESINTKGSNTITAMSI